MSRSSVSGGPRNAVDVVDVVDVAGRAPTVRLVAVPAQPDPVTESRLDVLCRDLAPIARNAVDTLEIAVSLEVRGIGDQNAREDFACSDVFALAAEIRERVVLDPRAPEPGPSPWRSTPGRHVLHGLLYGLPALCWPASAPLATGRAALALLVVSIVASWSASQALSYLGYVHLGVDDTRDARTVLARWGAVGLAVTVVVLAVLAAAVGGTPGALLFAVGQASYLIGASALMVLGAERWLLVALAPGVLAGTAFLAAGQPAPWFPAVWLCMAVTAVTAVAVAARCTRVAKDEARPFVRRSRPAQVVSHALFGALTAGLLVTPLVVAQMTGRSVGPGGFAALLALSISMGAAEASLVWFRRQATALMHRSSDMRRYARHARGLLLVGLGAFSAVAATLMALCSWVAALLGARVDPSPATYSYLALGAALFLALVIRALGGSPVVAPALAVALVVEIALQTLPVGPADPLETQAWVVTGLLVVLFVDGARVLGDPGRHL